MDSPLLSVRLNLMVAFDKNSNDSSDSFCLDMTWICLLPVYHWLIDWLRTDLDWNNFHFVWKVVNRNTKSHHRWVCKIFQTFKKNIKLRIQGSLDYFVKSDAHTRSSLV